MIDMRIRERAYAIWEQEGRPDGREYDHWVRATSEMAPPRAAAPLMHAAAKAAKPAAKPAARGKARKR